MGNFVGLSNLISGTTTDEFLNSLWPKEFFVVHGLTESIQPLTELPFLQSLDVLLKRWPKDIQVHLPDIKDECSAINASSEDARKLFANGMALLFNNVQEISPLLKNSILLIQKDLGLPTSTNGRCMVYATPDGKGTSPHFDQNINFVLQLHGTKKWWLAKNQSVENPTQRFTMGQPVDPELQGYLDGEMPTVMPKDCQEVILNPGSMLFVPRGYWHSTEAKGEALALNFTFDQPTWVDLFTAALRSRLLQSPLWRELADGVTSGEDWRRDVAQEKFDLLISELVEDVPHWRAEDILAATEGEPS